MVDGGGLSRELERRTPRPATRLAHLLTSGGDARLSVDPATRLNGYGCRPEPRHEALSFASSTATSISVRAFVAVQAAYWRLGRSLGERRFSRLFGDMTEELRAEIKTLLSLEGSDTEIVFSPSGTDAALHALIVARSLCGTPLVSVIAASDETGSGTNDAAQGRHFNSVTARGVPVVKGERIAGLADGVASAPLRCRNADGTLRTDAEMDDDVLCAVARAVAQGQRVLLYVMDHSKLGRRCPTRAALGEIRSAYGSSVVVAIDACQMRLSRDALKWYLDQGFMVAITGSKFFTGPPFSGALLVPPALAARMSLVADVPAGFRQYAARDDWPAAWGRFRNGLADGANVGQLLRWVAAVEEMRSYFAVPSAYRARALRSFAATVPSLIVERPELQPLPDSRAPFAADGEREDEMAVRTIFPFLLRRSGKAMALAEATAVYRALNRDITPLLPPTISIDEYRLAAQICHIGQPVAVFDSTTSTMTGALRISASSRFVSETWSSRGYPESLVNLDREFDRVLTILSKTQLAIRHFGHLQGRI
jgi:selenocysteine lyase/cysteine desulfurase